MDSALDAGDGDLPLLSAKEYGAPSLFDPADLLRDTRHRRNLPESAIPRTALLDPDGDIVRAVAGSGRGRRHPGWSCYHTDMWTIDLHGVAVGIVGMAVGAPFAVLVSEQLAASGAELVISITSAGHIVPLVNSPAFVLIDRALRDEGTSSHYLPPDRWSHLDDTVRRRLTGASDPLTGRLQAVSSWTTDAPYRETAAAIAAAAAEGVACVEMEAAALYAYATARQRRVVCLAHLTNTPAADTDGGDAPPLGFDKGADHGVHEALSLVRAIAVSLDAG